MNKQILLLRFSYWIAAIADFSIAILMLIPERMGLTEIVYPMGFASAVVFSWGVLLLMADRKPVERKWILIPTIIVVSLLSIIRILFSYNEIIGFSYTFLVLGIALITLMAYSYYYASSFKE